MLDKDVVDAVSHIHRQELYAGANTVCLNAAHHFYTITHDESHWLLHFCLLCQDKCAATSATTPLWPIEYTFNFQYIPTDLIDCCLICDLKYTLILYAKDHSINVFAFYSLINCHSCALASRIGASHV
jgi:hypothetical protein